jgi:cell division protein ZapD
MHTDTIVFQIAGHYLPKVSLCIERLMQTIEEASLEKHPVIHHYALNNIFEIIKLIEKPELKSRFLKEFMRIEHGVNKSLIYLSDKSFARLFVQIQVLSHMIGRFGENIHRDPFLQSLRLVQSSHSVDGELYSPQLLLWLENRPETRQADLERWLKQLKTLNDTVRTYLSLFREMASFETVSLHHGFYQCPLPVRTTGCLLIMLRMSKSTGFVPKMQIGHHGFSLRLCEAETMREVQTETTTIDLAICQL